MPDQDSRVVDEAENAVPTDSRTRANELVGLLLDDEHLSDEARSVLRHLQETPEDLLALDADELGTILLEGLS